MKITIVTVCFNAEDTIEKTINSVLSQTYKNIEYIIKDGKSTDQTIPVIEKYQDNPMLSFISRTDGGIYNAMNQALEMATGEYILFMNSGDIFHDNEVIQDVIPYLDVPVVYGNVIRDYQNKRKKECYRGRYHLMKLLLMGRMMSHQSVFTRTDVMKQLRFDESFKICADYDFIVRAKSAGYFMKYINRTISVVDNVDGVSSQACNVNEMRQEDDRSLKKNYPLWYWILRPLKFIVRKMV